MNPRKMLAVAVLAALPTLGGVARNVQPAAPQAQASWQFALGMDGYEALAMGITSAVVCSAFLVPGAIACGTVGAL